jgi:hypothetical protein
MSYEKWKGQRRWYPTNGPRVEEVLLEPISRLKGVVRNQSFTGKKLVWIDYILPFNKLSPHFILKKSGKARLTTHIFKYVFTILRTSLILMVVYCRHNSTVSKLAVIQSGCTRIICPCISLNISHIEKGFTWKLNFGHTYTLCHVPAFWVNHEVLSVQWLGYRLYKRSIGV